MAVVQQSDALLVRRYMQGDESAIAALIDRYQSRVYAFIYSKVSDKDLTEDIFQDTFVKVVDKLKMGIYNEEGKFISWVIRIAHNLVIDHYRAKKKMPMKRDTDTYSVFFDHVQCEPNIENDLINIQIQGDLHKLIEELPNEQKEVLKMRIFADMTFIEIAEQTGVSINTALGRMRYAIINIRRLVEKHQIILTNS
jgi:RNA polymerase sigma-70 factor, ECF subfamily